MPEAEEGDLVERMRASIADFERWAADPRNGGKSVAIRAASQLREALATLLRAEADRDEAVRALEPIAAFCKQNSVQTVMDDRPFDIPQAPKPLWLRDLRRAASVHARLSRTIANEEKT